MKKLFTLVALLACFLGAKAEWQEVYKIDYSTYQGFPFYVMGYVPEFDNGCMTDFGSNFRYETQATLDGDGDGKWKDGESSVGTVKTSGGTEYQKVTGAGPYWHQYFIADGIQTKLDGKYKVIARVKASAACSIGVNMGWGWGAGEQASATVAIPDGGDFQEVTWEYSGINGQSCNLVAQPGTCAETIEWLDLVVYEWVKPGQRPKEWLEDLENGNAETPWTDAQKAIKFDDMDNNFTICAWSKEKGHNMNADNGWDPFVSPIVVDPKDENNHVFMVDGQLADSKDAEGNDAPSAWDNQFWIQSKHAWPSGTTLKIKFRYMSDHASVKTNTQVHHQTPSDYLIWHAIGDITFTDEWQTFDGTMSIADDMANGWSIAFNLNAEVKEPVKFYFDDLSWQYLKLDEGYFISGINTNTTDSYDDLDNAIPFEDGELGLEATFGTKGDANTYVNQVMISTKRGDDQAFKGATLKPGEKVDLDPEHWIDYTASSNCKIDLPGLGVWKVIIDESYNAMAFEMLEGTPDEPAEPIDIITNATEVTVKGLEREYTEAEAEAAGIEKPVPAGQPWDNQFFLVANRTLKPGEVTVVKFSYKASKEAKTTTQLHGNPGAYIHWAAIGEVNFTEEWQDFENEYTIPNEAEGKDAKSIAFNMAEIKEACDYLLKDFQWYIKCDEDPTKTYENLLDETGSANLYVKEGAGTSPYQFGTDPSGITNVTAKKNSSSAIYNIAGQKVDNNFKGIVVKDGKKFVNK